MMVVFNLELPNFDEWTVETVLQRKAKHCTFDSWVRGTYFYFVWQEEELDDKSSK